MQKKKGIKRFFKLIAKLVVGIVSFVLLFVGAEFALSSMTVNGENSASDDMYIYLQTNGVHTDIIVPIKNQVYDWSKQIDIASTKSKDTNTQFVAIGWGDKGFYLETPTWAELKVSTALKAAFGLSSTAMHCTFHKDVGEMEGRRKINISVAQYKRLIAFINKSFEWENGQTILVDTKVRYDDSDTFYEATGSYSMLRTCNTWTNQALKAAGLKSCYWAAFERGVMYPYLND